MGIKNRFLSDFFSESSVLFSCFALEMESCPVQCPLAANVRSSYCSLQIAITDVRCLA